MAHLYRPLPYPAINSTCCILREHVMMAKDVEAGNRVVHRVNELCSVCQLAFLAFEMHYLFTGQSKVQNERVAERPLLIGVYNV
jgi:hypothetical protein